MCVSLGYMYMSWWGGGGGYMSRGSNGPGEVPACPGALSSGHLVRTISNCLRVKLVSVLGCPYLRYDKETHHWDHHPTLFEMIKGSRLCPMFPTQGIPHLAFDDPVERTGLHSDGRGLKPLYHFLTPCGSSTNWEWGHPVTKQGIHI